MTEKMDYLRKLKPGKLLAQLQEIFNDLRDRLAAAETLNQCYSKELRDILNHTSARDKSMRHQGAVLQAVLDMLAEHKHEVRQSKMEMPVSKTPELIVLRAAIGEEDIMAIENAIPGVFRSEQAVRKIKAERKAFRDALQDVIVSPLECQCCVKMRAVAWKAVNPEPNPPQAAAPKHILPPEVKENV